MKTFIQLVAITVLGLFLAACSPEVGSEKWCEKMDKTPKGEWSANDVKSYAENCVFRKKE